MPGVVIVESLGQGHILLHAAPDKSTRHIADLVSKQFDPYRYLCLKSQLFGKVSGSDVVPFVQEDGVWVQPAHWLRSEELARRPSKRDSPKDGAWRSAARS